MARTFFIQVGPLVSGSSTQTMIISPLDPACNWGLSYGIVPVFTVQQALIPSNLAAAIPNDNAAFTLETAALRMSSGTIFLDGVTPYASVGALPQGFTPLSAQVDCISNNSITDIGATYQLQFDASTSSSVISLNTITGGIIFSFLYPGTIPDMTTLFNGGMGLKVTQPSIASPTQYDFSLLQISGTYQVSGLYWFNPCTNHYKYSVAMPTGGCWVASPKVLPTITQIVLTGGQDTGGDYITILGSHFDDNAVVTLGGNLITTINVINSNTITGISPAHADGAVDVVVTNLDNSSATLPASYTYSAPQWWNFSSGFVISFWHFGGPPTQTVFTTIPITLQNPPVITPVQWNPKGSSPPTDTQGWYLSVDGFAGVDIVTTSPGNPKHARSWGKISAFATGNAFMLGGLPSVTYNNTIIYAGDDYAVGVTGPTIRQFEGVNDRLLGVLAPIAGTSLVPVPTIPTITNVNATGSTTYTYKIVARNRAGTTTPSPAGSVTTAIATIATVNPNIITFPSVAGALSYDIYRTVSGGTPSSTGVIGNALQPSDVIGTIVSFADPGLIADGSTPPGSNTTTSNVALPIAIMTMLLVGSTLYISTLDSGTNSTNWAGRVFAFNLIAQTWFQIGTGFSGGEVPYAMAWYNNRLWVGTNKGNGTPGNVYYIRPGIDTTFTKDTITPITPTISSVTTNGTPGVTSYTYVVVAKNAAGHSAGSPAVAVATGNAVLDSTNNNTIAWAAIPGASSYDVYRSISTGTPNSVGKIGNSLTLSLIDTGLAGDTTIAPVTNTATPLPGGVVSMLSFGGSLYVGCDSVNAVFAKLVSRSPSTQAYATVATGSGGAAKVNNGWLSLHIFNNVLYASFWNHNIASNIYSITMGNVVTLVYTGASDTLVPNICMFSANLGTSPATAALYALGGGLGLQCSLVATTSGQNWVDLSANLNTIATETALPVFGVIGLP